MSEPTIRVTARDLETGEQGFIKELAPGHYLVVCADPAYVAHEQVHANGTRVVTIKTRKGDDGE